MTKYLQKQRMTCNERWESWNCWRTSTKWKSPMIRSVNRLTHSRTMEHELHRYVIPKRRKRRETNYIPWGLSYDKTGRIKLPRNWAKKAHVRIYYPPGLSTLPNVCESWAEKIWRMRNVLDGKYFKRKIRDCTLPEKKINSDIDPGREEDQNLSDKITQIREMYGC